MSDIRVTVPPPDVQARLDLLARLWRRGIDETDLKLTDSGHDFVVSLDLMRTMQPRVKGAEVRQDQLTKLEATLLRALYTFAEAYGEGPVGVFEQLEADGWSDVDCAQLERLLEEEAADRQ